MTDATHTRESELREIWAQECERHGQPNRANNVRAATFSSMIEDSQETKAALAAMRRISAPIPLTPSDEMVVAACKTFNFHFAASYQDKMRLALQAALNLMGGKK